MPPTLFGELEVVKSYGHTAYNNPRYISSHVLCYISGNALNFIDTTVSSGSGKPLSIKPIIAEAQITAFGVFRRESLIAYAQRGSPIIQIIKYPLGSAVQHFGQDTDKEVHINSIEFSHDAKYLATLSGLPTYTVSIWDWKNNTLMASVDSLTPANCISFNPFNSLHLCTSFNSMHGVAVSRVGAEEEEGSIRFWKLDMGFKANLLKSVTGHECCLDEQPPAHIDPNAPIIEAPEKSVVLAPTPLFPRGHVWQVDEQVIATVESGDSIVQYNPVNGESRVLFSAWKSRYQVEKDRAVAEGKKVVGFTADGEAEEGKRHSEVEHVEHSHTEEHVPKRDDFVKSEYGGSNNFQCVLATKDSLVVGGQDGILRFVNYDGDVSAQIQVIKNGASIAALAYSPDFKEICITASDQCIYTCDLSTLQVRHNIQIDSEGVIGMGLFAVSDFVVTAHKDNSIKFWDPDSKLVANRFRVGGNVSAIATHPLSSVLALGTASGVLRIFDVAFSNSKEPRLLLREKVCSVGVKQLKFDPTGRFLLAFGDESSAVLIDVTNKCQVVGFIQTPASITSAVWDIEEVENEDEVVTSLILYIMVQVPYRTSLILKYNVPLDKDFSAEAEAAGYSLAKSIKNVAKYRIEENVSDFVVVSSGVSSSRSFYTICEDKKLKVFTRPSNSHEDHLDSIPVGTPILEFSDHDKPNSKLLLSISTEWLFTFSPDGYITARNFLEPEKSTKVFAHDSAIGGVQELTVSRDVHKLYSTGYDGIVRVFEWKSHMAAARRALIEAAEAAEIAVGTKLEAIKKVVDSLNKTPTRDVDPADVADEPYYFDVIKTKSGPKAAAFAESEGGNVGYDEKIKIIRERILKAMQRNETLNDLEKIPKADFILDFAERDRLWAESDARVKQVRKEIELENLKKRVIRNRIKAECWDSMEVIGASIKSFRPDPTTTKTIELEKVRLLRKIQLHAEAIANKSNSTPVVAAPPADDVILDSATTEAPPPVAEEELSFKDFKSLLYGDFDLTTNERKRTQILLLDEATNEIKMEFNTKFKEFFKVKKDEMLKIDDKNERINNIMAELVKAAQEDNYRERGLMIMMGGKLDDKSEETEKEELVRPDWMNKPKEEMNEEEKKLVKEFEKKLATMKEEQEKYRKALETELKKLQGSVLELCDNFDGRLKDLLVKKLEADQAIFKNELKRIKLQQSILLAENDETKELKLNQRLEELKAEKIACAQHMPEIKKELDHFKDEYETSVRRDKEIDKLFKKEFSTLDPSFDSLYKLFKRRELVKTAAQEAAEAAVECPFPGVDPPAAATAVDPADEVFAPLVYEKDAIEGMTSDSWSKLVELRDRKIASEVEVKITQHALSDFQAIHQNVNDEAERIRKETDKVMSDLAAFAEYRFHTTYNPETLFELKQGQVEVPQAPVVTDYSDAELIHRSVVEKLNDNIVALDYRKGIHALEWENKMLDFQAEDLVIRTRDIQLLRVTKQMQEYIRGGDERKQTNEIIALEKRSEHNSKSHVHKLEDRAVLVEKYKKKIGEKKKDNDKLEARLRDLEVSVKERRKIHDVQVKRKTMAGGTGTSGGDKAVLNDIYTRRKLVDLAKSQAQDIAILREEVERLRLRTYPAFPSKSLSSAPGLVSI
ncbi:WD40 repeat-like protein [Rhizoclosmatium globosum]|uniref:WD40 repeat-like protein n=1 Tax=Rhizoclosmatium globosum TaxID=329046 RepID=A0A1Y2BXC9_9FUNG|nr:WD40 repeat-like protein [Rhizoclosmatium globosum]|eukprot:ORY39430.1 WD40 repeat-like protein [Rhizoclosmatium globosum]